MSRSEIDEFLSKSKILLRLGTADSKGNPQIHPVWYHYANNKLYLMSDKRTKKVQNIMRKNTVYFSVDTEVVPYKGVKGKGMATMVKDREKAVSLAEKIVTKYLGDPNHPLGKTLLGEVRNGSEVLIEITPDYYSVWDYGKTS